MPFKLSGVSLNRVDLCPQGANPDASIVLFKTKGGHVPKPQKKGVKKAAAKAAKSDTRSKARQRGEEEEEDDEEEAVTKRRAKAQDDEEDDDELEDDDDLEDEDDDAIGKSDEDDEEDEDGDEEDEEEEDEDLVKAKGKRGKKIVAKRQTDDDESADDEDDDDADDAEPEPLDEAVLKSLPAKTRAYIRKQHELFAKQTEQFRKVAREAKRSAKAALEAATIEKDRRETLESIEKAKQVVPNLPGTDEEKGAVMKAIASLPKEIAKSLRRMLKSGDAAVKNLLMAETGTRRGRTDGEDDAVSELRAAADDILKKDSKLTKEQAFAKACEANPDLFAQYKKEKRSRDRAN